jgi:hypothetical protein
VEGTGGAIEALFVTDSREVFVTPGLKNRFRLTDSRFTLKD